MNTKLKSDIDAYVEQRNKKDELAKRVKETNGIIAELELAILKEMDTLELKGIKSTTGIMVSVVENSYPRIIDKDKVYNWLHSKGFNALFTVNAQTFRGFFNDRLKSGEELPSEGIEHYTKTTLSLTGR